jgi:ABC-type hemin transport system ATPase subunit
MVCHDILLAPMFVDIALLMKDGSVIAAGDVRDVLSAQRLSFAFGAGASISWHGQRTVHATFGEGC